MLKISAALSLAMLAVSYPLSAQSASYQENQVSNGGSISGKVRFTGEDQPPLVFRVTKDNEVCGTGEREIDYVRVNGDALTDVVVYLDKIESGKPFPAALSEASLDQEGCEFKPFLQIMRDRTPLTSINKDSVLHNVHAYALLRGNANGPKRTLFNFNQPDPGSVKKQIKLPGRANALKVECDAHDYMHSFVFVAKNPYFARVEEDGSYRITDVPPGEYTLKAWHGTLQGQQAKVNVTAGATASVDFLFK
jgi:hypothetical protein